MQDADDTFRFTVKPDEAGVRLDHFLVEQALPLSRSQLKRHIDEGGARVGGEVAKPARKLRPGELVELTLLPRPPSGIVAEAIPLTVLYEDDEVIVLDKPANLVVHPAAGHATGTLVNALAYHFGLAPSGAVVAGSVLVPNGAATAGDSEALDGGEALDGAASPGRAAALEGAASPDRGAALDRGAADGAEPGEDEDGADAVPAPFAALGSLRPGIVHRLDKDTTGVMIVAKTDAALTALAAQFKDRTIERRYVALVQGKLAAREGRWETAYGRDPRDRKKFSSKVADASADGSRVAKRAATRWWVLDEATHGALADATLVEAKLETGRTHQLRVHFADHGHPLVGDPLYGRPPRGEPLREVAKQLARQALHARLLGFLHPRTGAYLEFASPLPPDLCSALAALRVP